MDKLTKIIFDALTKHRDKQVNLASESARKTVAIQIAQQIKKNM